MTVHCACVGPMQAKHQSCGCKDVGSAVYEVHLREGVQLRLQPQPRQLLAARQERGTPAAQPARPSICHNSSVCEMRSGALPGLTMTGMTIAQRLAGH